MKFLVQCITREYLVLYDTIYQCVEHTGSKLNREQNILVPNSTESKGSMFRKNIISHLINGTYFYILSILYGN